MKSYEHQQCLEEDTMVEGSEYGTTQPMADNSVLLDQMNSSLTCDDSPTPGSATVLGSAANSESAYDNSYTPHLVSELQNNPNLSLDEVLSLTSDDALTVNNPSQPKHHMTIVQYGQNTANSTECRDSERKAVLIANQTYNHNTKWSNLSTPTAEANSMAGELRQRGYETTVLQDQNSNEMDRAWSGMIDQATEGDDLVAFYGGHGAYGGLAGVDDSWTNNDLFSNNQVANAATTTTSKGAHLRFIMDSCHSGAAVEAVREVRLNELASHADSVGDHLYVIAAETCTTIKSDLLAHVAQRSDALLQNTWAINAAKTTEEMNKLKSTRKKIIQAYDQRAFRLWSLYKETLNSLAIALSLSTGNRIDAAPAAIANHQTLGEQIDYCDMLANMAMTPMEREIAGQEG